MTTTFQETCDEADLVLLTHSETDMAKHKNQLRRMENLCNHYKIL